MKAMVSSTDERTISVHQEHEFLKKLEVAGLTGEFAQKVIDSKGNDLATKVVRLIQKGGFEPTTSQKRAREIMGRNFFGIEEAIKHFGVNPTRQQTLALSEIPFSEEVLQKAKDTHVLVAVFPLSILEIRGKVDSRLFCDQSWYNEESVARDRGKTSWHLVSKTPVNNSTSKNWEEQLALIGEEDEVPTAQVMVYTIIGHYLATDERLFEHIYVRTSSVASVGRRLFVGAFDLRGLYVCYDWDDYRSADLGVSSARKF
ncbi:MAG: hypothetical protein PHI53_01825 [Candidatus Pacebacteria bacterium]|nr:hypothetical protein [Candidatus Paceibacterota bacterium]